MTAVLVAMALLWAATVAAGGPPNGRLDGPAAAGSAAEFASGCLGDCDGDGRVTIDEIVRGVRIALGEATRTSCPRAGPGHSLAAIEVLTYAVRHALDGCATAHDFSGFNEFEYAQRSALGFCLPIDSLLSASIRREGGTYLLSTSLVGAGTPGVDACLDPFGTFDGDETCRVALPQPCRLLTPEEGARIREAFASVALQDGPDAICLDVIADPCVINSVRWDQTDADDYPHSSLRIGDADLADLLGVLESLDAGPVTPCPAGPCGDGRLNFGEACDDGNNFGGDGCAANCMNERRRPCIFDLVRTHLLVQTVAIPIEIVGPAGLQIFVTGAPRNETVVNRHGDVISRPGDIPVVVKGEDFLTDVVHVTGLVCVCLRAEPYVAFGPGVAASGTIACGETPLDSTGYRVVQDHNTSPGDRNNRGGVPDDPECNDTFLFPDGSVSAACREGVGADCSDEAHEHTGVCNSPRRLEWFPDAAPRGSALINYRLAIELLQDAGACSAAGPPPGRPCPFPDYGVDCLPCTDDDRGQSIGGTIVMTTGAAEATVLDANNNSFPQEETAAVIDANASCYGIPCRTTAHGSLFDCAALAADPTGGVSGSALAGALPFIDAPQIGDAVTTIVLGCE